MLLGLTGGETVLLVVALVFIAFALVASMYVPRVRPDFPGDRLGLFVLVSVLLFVAMATAVVTTAGGEEHGAEAAVEETSEDETTPEPEGRGGETGDAAAGEAVFASAGCGGCHVLEAAGTSGNVGPNLDESQPSAELVVERVTEGMGTMPSFADELSEQQIRDVAAYVSESTRG